MTINKTNNPFRIWEMPGGFGEINFPLKFLEASQCNLYLIKSSSSAATASWESIPQRKWEKALTSLERRPLPQY